MLYLLQRDFNVTFGMLIRMKRKKNRTYSAPRVGLVWKCIDRNIYYICMQREIVINTRFRAMKFRSCFFIVAVCNLEIDFNKTEIIQLVTKSCFCQFPSIFGHSCRCVKILISVSENDWFKLPTRRIRLPKTEQK